MTLNTSTGQLLLSYMNKMDGGFFICRMEEMGEILFANDKFLNLYECSTWDELESVTGKSARKLIYYLDQRKILEVLKQQLYSGKHPFHSISCRIQTAKKNIRQVEAHVFCVKSEDSVLLYGFVEDYHDELLLTQANVFTHLPDIHHLWSYARSTLKKQAQDGKTPNWFYVYFDIHQFNSSGSKNNVKEELRFLKRYADCVGKYFCNDCIAYAGSDHIVVFTGETGLFHKIGLVHAAIASWKNDRKKEVKIGIYQVQQWNENPIESCENARLACASIQEQAEAYFCLYTPELQKHAKIREYTSTTLEEALEKGYIKIYYQPIIRTLNGAVCGMETLVRWDDPKHGLLSPKTFIDMLETTHKIHKLDIHVVRELCRRYQELRQKGLSLLPVSFNLSKLDFLYCDIFQEVEDAVRTYQVPRSMLHIEITESALAYDASYMQQKLEKFRQHGYQIWMDDFGSGYSTLKFLKQYPVNGIKLDMDFMFNLNEKGRQIVISFIDMCKKLNVQTLVEGVETQGQYEFLKEIGCEMVQGYYFGRPLPYEEYIAHCNNQHMLREPLEKRDYYDAISRVNILSDPSVALYEYDGKDFTPLFVHQKYAETMKKCGICGIDALKEHLNNPDHPLYQTYRNVVDSIPMPGNIVSIKYFQGERYLHTVSRNIAAWQNLTALQVTMTDITDETTDELAVTRALRSLQKLYDSVFLLNLESDYAERLMSRSRTDKAPELKGPRIRNLDWLRKYYADRHIYPADRERYDLYSDPRTMLSRIQECKGGFLMEHFRIKNEEGCYEWAEHSIFLPDNTKNIVVSCVKHIPLTKEKIKKLFTWIEDGT